MFGSILMTICAVMAAFVFWRSASVPLIARHVPKKIVGIGGAAFWISIFAGRYFGHGGAGTADKILEMLGMNLMVVLFLLFISVLTMDLITGFGLFWRKSAPSLRGWALVGGGALSVIALTQGLRPPVVTSYELQVADLPPEMDPTTIVALSDLHLGSQLEKRWLSARVEQVRTLKPDMVVLLGDNFEGHGPYLDDLLPSFRRLSAPLGVWAVLGNHESYHGGSPGVKLMERAGIDILRNRWVEIRPGFLLAGVEDLTTHRQHGDGEDLVLRALAGKPPGATVLMSHTPWEAETAARKGVDLMLSGHTHGGQVWPFGYLVRIAYPLLEGRYTVEGMPVIVSRGTGSWGSRMRLWHPGEILQITLRGSRTTARPLSKDPDPESQPVRGLPGKFERRRHKISGRQPPPKFIRQSLLSEL